MKKLLVFLPLFLMIMTGCTSMNIQDTDKIPENDGILVTRINADCTGCKLPIINKNNWTVSSAIFKVGGNKWHVIALPAGKYSWRGLYFGADAAEFRGKLTFEITPGRINYIGDIQVKSEPGKKAGTAAYAVYRIYVIDNHKRAALEMKAAYPNLYAHYPFIVHLTQDKRSSEDVYITGT